MANSVLRDRQGPDWPLGNIVVPTPGTPVRITNLVDATAADAPETAVGGPTPTGASGVGDEYTYRANQIVFQAYKVGAAPPAFTPNTGNIYILRKAGSGSNNKTDIGVIVAILQPGQTFTLGSSALVRNDFNPHRYWIDADTANDACQVTLIIQ
jgi:hypothetical protein